MKKILFKFPSRERPDKFFAALDNIHDLIGYDNFSILCSLDFDDKKMNTDYVRNRIMMYPKCIAAYWKSSCKVEAINRDMELSNEWDIGVLMSDDMKFLVDGFGKIIVEDMEEHFPDLDGVLHYPDGHANEKLITLSIMGKRYYERDNYWYNPIYKSVACDNEFTSVAYVRGKCAYLDKRLFYHEHPIWGYGESDNLLLRNEEPIQYQLDLNTLEQRKAINFGI